MTLRVLALLLAFGAAGVAEVRAALPARDTLLSDYRITSWTSADGIVFGGVRSIAQDADGYLWLACDAGVVRFDGFRFSRDVVVGDMPLPAGTTKALRLARDGALWVGYGDGHGVYRIVHGVVRDIHLQGIISGFVNVITEDRAGGMWVGDDAGVHYARGRLWETLPWPDRRARRTIDIYEDRHGVVWLATDDGLYRRSMEGVVERVPGVDGVIYSVTEDAAGALWISDQRHGFRRLGDAGRAVRPEGRGMTLLYARSGDLWVATTGQGLWLVPRGPGGLVPSAIRRATLAMGLANDELKPVFEDRDGNVWTGAVQGISRLTPHKVTSLVDVGIASALALDDDGTAWLGTPTGLLAVRPPSAAPAGIRRRFPSSPVRAIHRARNGRVWVATDAGLQFLDGARLVPAAVSSAPPRAVVAMASDSQGHLWLCDLAQGVLRLDGRQLSHVTAFDGETSARPVALHVDAEDRLWVGFDGGAVRMMEPSGQLHRFGPATGLPHRTIYTLRDAPDGGIWIAGNAGLSLLRDGRIDNIGTRQGLPDRAIAAMFAEENGDLWVAFHGYGIARFSREDLARAIADRSYRLVFRLYGPADGMAGMPWRDQINGGSAVDGRADAIWFVTTRGITLLDPRVLRGQETRPPDPPRIEQVTAGDQRFGALGTLTLPARTSRLRIDYTVVDVSSADQLQFRYRLDGFDTDWVDGSGPRQALYTNLRPGRYRFRLQARANAASWSTAEADWAFVIQPTFWETGWFYALVVVGLALAGAAGWRLRVRKVHREVALVYGERLRLSREIHDTLLQSLAGMALQLDATAHDVAGLSPRAYGRLVTMREQVEEHIREARRTIWDLRSPLLDRHGLVGALRAAGDRLAAGKVGFELTVHGTPRACPPGLELQVLRIGHEALMNAVRHADATRVRMEVGFEERTLRLRVADDGRGFEARTDGQGDDLHYGLISMQERAADAGGRCTIASVPGSGVDIVVEFPLTPAA